MRKPHASEERKPMQTVPQNHHAASSISTTYVMVIPRDSITHCEILAIWDKGPNEELLFCYTHPQVLSQ